MQNFDLLGSMGLFFFCTLLRISRQGVSSSICLAPIIIHSKVVTKEFLSPVDVFAAQPLCVHVLTEVVMVG